MKRLVLVLVLVLMAGSLPATNWTGDYCYVPQYEYPSCYCIRYDSQSFGPPFAYTQCEQHNPCWGCQGPGWCETSGECSIGWVSNSDIRRVLAKERDSIAILDFLVDFQKMTEKQRLSFAAEVDEKVGDGLTECEIEARHDAYRAKFAELMGIELRPGNIPASPSRTKKQAPPPITASMAF